MKQQITQQHRLDAKGNPAGGTTTALGLSIEWQNGPLVDPGERVIPGKLIEPNGCFVETVIKAAIGRLNHYQDLKFKCRENALAITKLEEALHWLKHRFDAREERGVYGTHEV